MEEITINEVESTSSSVPSTNEKRVLILFIYFFVKENLYLICNNLL